MAINSNPTSEVNYGTKNSVWPVVVVGAVLAVAMVVVAFIFKDRK